MRGSAQLIRAAFSAAFVTVVLGILPSHASARTRAPTATPTPGAESCQAHPGDCNASDSVTINELISCVNIALGSADPSSCEACDGDYNGSVAINELMAAVNAAQSGCPFTPKPTRTARPTRTPLPPKPGPTFVKDHIAAQCMVDPKGLLNDREILHVTLIIRNDSGAAITDIEPDDVVIDGDATVTRAPNGIRALADGYTGRFVWTLAGNRPVRVYLSATFTDPEGVDKTTGPIPCQYVQAE
jgi:hypothetical protein